MRFDGATTGREILAATDALVAHPDFEADFDQLWVLADVTTLAIDPDEMGALISHDRTLVETGTMGHVRVAIVVTGELRTLAIQLYGYRMRSTGQTIRLFETEPDAVAWLRHSSGERPTS